MIVVIQKVTQAAVNIENKLNGKINEGLMILLGITHDDNESDIEWLSGKIVNLRIFNDEDGKMNRSILDVGGDILLVSQFTLHASTKKGNRPGYNDAAKPDIAIPLYEKMIVALEDKLGKKIETGEFGAMMEVSLVNDGPVTIIIDSKNKK
ncbi:D-aminoacyl-tRNA deacylase [Flexithrix dorotheae]|uniref:D-aminoacyl-tRNA deacylase n=1 Tax=Flexithrix dorotheae TaxID=70993 RepID=UPI00037C43D0|nr:D-aminoacyl-tRNA deacylase [Flexithrix dorotheae]